MVVWRSRNPWKRRDAFYDTDTGYIHYVSDILPKLECRVYDGVRTFEDALLDQRNAVQFIPNLYGNVSPEQIREHDLKLFHEAVSVSNKGVAFMDRIMKNSPFRDYDAWLNQPDGQHRHGSKEKRARRR